MVTRSSLRSVPVESSELGDVVPPEYRADLVLVLEGADGRPALAIVIEVQLRGDPRKRFTWPVYVASLRARFECPVLLLVVVALTLFALHARAQKNKGDRPVAPAASQPLPLEAPINR